MTSVAGLPLRQRSSTSETGQLSPKPLEKRLLDRSLSESDVQGADSQNSVRLDIILKPASKDPPCITMSPVKPAPANVRCKLAEERRKSYELEVVQKQKEHDEKILAAQKYRQECDEKKQQALRAQYEKRIKASEENLALQNLKVSEKNAAIAKKHEEVRKAHEENIAAKKKDAEQKLAKTAIFEEKREQQMEKLLEKLHDRHFQIQVKKEKAEQQQREEIEKKRKEAMEKEMLAEKNRESQIMARKETLHKHIERVNSGKKREKQTQG